MSTKEKEAFDFSKPGESITYKDGMVVKYFQDPKIVTARVQRAAILDGLVPLVEQVDANHYQYPYVEGSTIYESLAPQLTTTLLEWCQKYLWNPSSLILTKEQQQQFKNSCEHFYRVKTLDRVKLYWEQAQHDDTPSQVNGTYTPSLSSLIERINWNKLTNGIPSRFHGDLQFDNILVSPTGDQFTLLDWRHEFGGLLEYGDLYYDLAKLYGGLILPYNTIKQNKFSFERIDDKVTLDIDRSPLLDQAKQEFENFINQHGLDMSKIHLLTGVIFINMSPLHTKPFNYYLHHLGKLILSTHLHEQNK